ncbi:MAG: GNAT family N-acetyltransferase [Thalassotalea sp.]|nr:GNAT family N-acetyltransferase [Thalassotalea sp.]
MNEIEITSNPTDLDLNVIHAFISESYWAKNIPMATLKKAISNSLVFGAYKKSGEQVGFARVVTDKATFAYLGDVFVLNEYRGLGLSKLLMQSVCAHPDLQGLRRFMLATSDAHGLYSQFGFTQVENPEILMQIWQPGIYDDLARA